MKHWFYVILTLLVLSSCVGEDYPSKNTPADNFEALWRIMDEHYCFFDYKQQVLGVDWNEVHSRYAAKINPKMDNLQLFEVLCQMLGELKDGHVNLGASFDFGRNWSYFEDYPDNYNAELIERYLGKGNDYQIASSLKYRILDDNIAYVRCESFANGIGDGNLTVMLDQLKSCSGMIVDVRNNGGGQLTAAHRLAARFTNEKLLIGYVCHKTGKGHNDFSALEAEYLEPSDGVRWQKPVVVLTNRQCFSATNDFVKCMKLCPQATVLGDSTGGGSGMPFTLELPNGWSVRYSAVVYYDAQKQHTEFGIAPDVKVSLDSLDVLKQKDTLIESARELMR